MTLQDIAQQIETIQPDLKEFFEYLHNDSPKSFASVINEPNTYVQLLKAELYMMYFLTHNQRWADYQNRDRVQNILAKHLSIIPTASTNNRSYGSIYSLAYDPKLDQSAFIVANLTEPKKYLPQYLKKRFFPAISNVVLKQPKDDVFSFNIFKKYIESLPKGVSSIQTEGYIDKVLNFNNTKEQYIELVLDNCKNPSIKLQKKLHGYLQTTDHSKANKYMYLCRWRIMSIAKALQVPVSEAIFDQRDSDYKPFITNLSRIPTTDLNQFTALADTILILQTSIAREPNEVFSHFVEALIEHLSDPAYKANWTEYLTNLQNHTIAANSLIATFKE